jgi:TPR repeat protein
MEAIHLEYGDNPNLEEVYKTYKLGAEAGETECKFGLAVCYKDGKGVEKNEQQSTYWLNEAAREGSSSAIYHLAEKCIDGKNEGMESNEILKYLYGLSEKGDCHSNLLLGRLFLHGDTKIRNYDKSLVYLNMALQECKHRIPKKKSPLAFPPEVEDILYKYLRCDTPAMGFLGELYEGGLGVPKDYATAYMWYNLQSARGGKDADEKRKSLEDRMTPEQIAEAQKLSREWVEKHKKN